MNEQQLFDPVYFWPFVALAARYKQDSGDKDVDTFDMIEDTIGMWLPGTKVHRFFNPDKLDFTYAVEDNVQNQLLIVGLGTEGGLFDPGWIGDLSPQIERDEYWQRGGHVDFIKAGERVFDAFGDLIFKYSNNVVIAGHSRGVRVFATARKILRETGSIPRRVIGYCVPGIFNHKGAHEYNSSGLGGATIEVVNPHDLVDNLGWPLLQHVGSRIKLPDANAPITNKPVVGPLVMGHAYSAVHWNFKLYCEQSRLDRELEYLHKTEWVCTI
jgi:hypothetical protein